MKRTFITVILFVGLIPLFAESGLSKYYKKTFYGNMMGKIITADMTIVDDEKIEFIVNLPSGTKNHVYSYIILKENDSEIAAEWYENGKADKRVKFSNLTEDSFDMELKGKGKIKMKEIK